MMRKLLKETYALKSNRALIMQKSELSKHGASALNFAYELLCSVTMALLQARF